MAKTNASPTCQKHLQVNVVVEDDQTDLTVDPALVKACVCATLERVSADCDEVAIYLVTEEAICHLHSLHFNDPTPTDCITLPVDAPGDRSSGTCLLGEGFICPKVAIEQAVEHQVSPLDEVLRYVAHCVLHMCGFEDETEEKKMIMRAHEDVILSALTSAAVTE